MIELSVTTVTTVTTVSNYLAFTGFALGLTGFTLGLTGFTLGLTGFALGLTGFALGLTGGFALGFTGNLFIILPPRLVLLIEALLARRLILRSTLYFFNISSSPSKYLIILYNSFNAKLFLHRLYPLCYVEKINHCSVSPPLQNNPYH